MGGGFQNVAFLSSRVSFSTTCLRNCGRGENVGIATCDKTEVGVRQGHAPYKILLLHIACFVSVIFSGNHRTAAKMRQNLTTLCFWDIA